MNENFEEVEKTLEEIKAQQKKPVVTKKWKRVLYFVFFPFIKLYQFFIKLKTEVKL